MRRRIPNALTIGRIVLIPVYVWLITTCDGGRSWPAVAKASRQWQTAVAIAKIVDQDLMDSGAPNALFFHARRVSPGWRLKRVASIGNHVFYR